MSSERFDLYQRVTDKIIAQLEAGCLPWVQPWRNGASPRSRGIALPHNAHTGRSYSGINIVLLWDASEAYGSHGWLTFKQALELGGNVRKGEKGSMVVYADKFIPKGERARVETEGGDARAIYFLKSYTVFNREQCEGLPGEPAAAPAPTLPELIASADQLIRNSRAQIVVGGDRAAYWPAFDRITLPSMAAYAPHEINWYRTALHELTHWTGHESRLARQFAMGGSDYAREELVAEMGAAFTCASLGIEPTVRHSDYIGAWLGVLREDNRAIVQAASKASKAADYLLAFAGESEMREAA